MARHTPRHIPEVARLQTPNSIEPTMLRSFLQEAGPAWVPAWERQDGPGTGLLGSSQLTLPLTGLTTVPSLWGGGGDRTAPATSTHSPQGAKALGTLERETLLQDPKGLSLGPAPPLLFNPQSCWCCRGSAALVPTSKHSCCKFLLPLVEGLKCCQQPTQPGQRRVRNVRRLRAHGTCPRGSGCLRICPNPAPSNHGISLPRCKL